MRPKAKYMFFRAMHCPYDSLPVLNLQLTNVPIERVKQFDFLGLIISDTLTFIYIKLPNQIMIIIIMMIDNNDINYSMIMIVIMVI